MKTSVLNLLGKPLVLIGISLVLVMGFVAWMVTHLEFAMANSTAIVIGGTVLELFCGLLIFYWNFFKEVLHGIAIIFIWVVLRIIWIFVELVSIFKKFWWTLKTENWPYRDNRMQFLLMKGYVVLIFVGAAVLANSLFYKIAIQDAVPLASEIALYFPFILLGIGFLMGSRKLTAGEGAYKNNKIASIIFSLGLLLLPYARYSVYAIEDVTQTTAMILSAISLLIGALLLTAWVTPKWKDVKLDNIRKVKFKKGFEHLQN